MDIYIRCKRIIDVDVDGDGTADFEVRIRACEVMVIGMMGWCEGVFTVGGGNTMVMET